VLSLDNLLLSLLGTPAPKTVGTAVTPTKLGLSKDSPELLVPGPPDSPGPKDPSPNFFIPDPGGRPVLFRCLFGSPVGLAAVPAFSSSEGTEWSCGTGR